MKVLFAVPYMPSPIRARSYNFILELARRGHQITLAALRAKHEQPSDDLREACKEIITVPTSKFKAAARCGVALLAGDSLWIASCKSGTMSRILEESCRSEDFDVLHVEHIRGTSFMNGAKAKVRVLDAVDCMEPLLARIAQHKKNPIYKYVINVESRRIGKEEAGLSQKFDKIIITSEREKELLRERDPIAPVDVVPIGVDLEKFKPLEEAQDSMRLIFTGKMSYFPNADAVLWFAENVFPKLREKLPKISLTVAGAEPGPEVQELNQIEGIDVTGFVPELEAVLQRSGIAICPLRIAAGAQFKVIEAMACGLPVVASPLAARTIKNCDSMLKAETVDEWIDVISGLVNDQARARAIGMANHDYIENNYSWKSSVDLLENTYQRALVPTNDSPVIAASNLLRTAQ